MTESNDKNEFLFSEYIRDNYIGELERFLNTKIKNIEVLEHNNKMSMQGISLDGQEIKVSWQLDDDFKKQIIRIQNLIISASNTKKTIIIYGALNFNEEINQELMLDVVFFSEKNIRLAFLQINHQCLTLFNNIKKLDNPFINNPFINKKEITIYNS